MRRVGEPLPEPIPEVETVPETDADTQNNSGSVTTAAVTEENTASEQRVTTPRGSRKKD